jgi:hypothetical protein
MLCASTWYGSPGTWWTREYLNRVDALGRAYREVMWRHFPAMTMVTATFAAFIRGGDVRHFPMDGRSRARR